MDIGLPIPRTHLPGARVEFDFGEFHNDPGYIAVTCWDVRDVAGVPPLSQPVRVVLDRMDLTDLLSNPYLG